MNYRTTDEHTAQIGIKICETAQQGKGYGTILLRMFINELFNCYGFSKIMLDTNVNNTRAQATYEKLGFVRVGVRENS